MPKPAVERRYWDTGCYLAILNEEPDAPVCRRIIEQARQGEIELVTSFWTMAEVIRKRRSPQPIPADLDQEINDFFENDYIQLYPVDRLVAERSRALCREWSLLYACDGVHLATALLAKCSVLEAKDGQLLTLDGRIEGLTLRQPTWSGQESLFQGDQP